MVKRKKKINWYRRDVKFAWVRKWILKLSEKKNWGKKVCISTGMQKEEGLKKGPAF